jgi:hypothetical protein
VKSKPKDPDTEYHLRQSAHKERRYLVPGTGHGYTLSLEQAQDWAQARARYADHPVSVIAQDVELSHWEVVSNHVSAELGDPK